jgi:hypothetical protein
MSIQQALTMTSIRWVAIVWLSLGFSVMSLATPLPDGNIRHVDVRIQDITPRQLLTQTQRGHRLNLRELHLKGEATPLTMELEQFEVFAPDAHIIVNDGSKVRATAPPQTKHFRGHIQGYADSLAVLNVDTRGRVSGMVTMGERIWSLDNKGVGPDAGLSLVDRDIKNDPVAPASAPFQCEADATPKTGYTSMPDLLSVESFAQPPAAALPAGQYYQAKVALETDYPLYAKFNSETGLKNYIANLFAYVSSIYERETQTQLLLGNIYIYTSATAEPWGTSTWSYNDAYSGAMQFQKYWNLYRTGVSRTTAHFLSGKDLRGGWSYIGVLCNTAYGYGFSSSLSGQVSTSQTIWDTLVVAHEVGHNFNTGHTHDYQNIGGDSNPVDSCFLGGPTGPYKPGFLPGLNNLNGGTPGMGTGTIMSYCHLVNNNLGDISMTFGQTHPYGIKAYRVPDRMKSHVADTALKYPSCLPIVSSLNPVLTVSKTGSGSGTVTSSPAGINCGPVCGSSFTKDTVVTLSQSPATGSQFSGWGGACSGSGTCSVTMDASKSVTATFVASTSYALTVRKTGTGTVTSNPTGITCGTACTASYASGTQVTLTAAPGTGFKFSSWSGACTGTGTTCTTTMTAAKTVTATFVASTSYALTVRKAGTGTGTVTSSPTGINCGTACTASYASGTSVRLTATPATGSRFSSWSGGCTGTSTTCTTTMTAAKTVTASFLRL